MEIIDEASADYPLGGSIEPYDMARDQEVLEEHDFYDIELRTAAGEMTLQFDHKAATQFFGRKSRQHEFMLMPSARWSRQNGLTSNDINMMAMQGAIT